MSCSTERLLIRAKQITTNITTDNRNKKEINLNSMNISTKALCTYSLPLTKQGTKTKIKHNLTQEPHNTLHEFKFSCCESPFSFQLKTSLGFFFIVSVFLFIFETNFLEFGLLKRECKNRRESSKQDTKCIAMSLKMITFFSIGFMNEIKFEYLFGV